jgi:hypothetical protein
MIQLEALEQRVSLTTVRAIGIFYDNVPINTSKRAAIVNAINIQVDRDLVPVWNTPAIVNGYTKLRKIPRRTWIVDVSYHSSAYGIHYTQNNIPAASVEFERGYTYAISHEVLEMLVDPYGDRYSPNGELEEICDPLVPQSYKIDGISVARFVTPAYYR